MRSAVEKGGVSGRSRNNQLTMADNSAGSDVTKGRGEFFAIDRRTWAVICEETDLNDAVTYLVLAQGTEGSNRFTSWSATSLKKYAGISWTRAQDALRRLVMSGLVKHAEGSRRERPRYELLDYSTTTNRAKTTSPDPDLDPIWLPNTIVTGTDRGEDSPVKRLRAAGDLWALRLFIELYYEHNLRDDGGISPELLREDYTRTLIGESGSYNLWEFAYHESSLDFHGPLLAHRERPEKPGAGQVPAWDSIDLLRAQGLVSFVPHLWEQDPVTEEAEVIHPYGVPECGDPLEIDLGLAANSAALSMVNKFRRDFVPTGWLAPVQKTLLNVQMVGVARLRYRPRTKRTSAWRENLLQTVPGWIEKYQKLEAAALAL